MEAPKVATCLFAGACFELEKHARLAPEEDDTQEIDFAESKEAVRIEDSGRYRTLYLPNRCNVPFSDNEMNSKCEGEKSGHSGSRADRP